MLILFFTEFETNILSHQPKPVCALCKLAGFAAQAVFVDSAQTQTRDAFGSPYLGNLDNDIGFGYCGKVYDIGTGLYDYGFRDYSPNNARFTTVDPIRDGSNWFSYVVNDPVNYVDPFGLSASDSKWTNNGDGTYTAKPGATLWGLQQETGVNWQDFGFDRSPETLQVGETITVHGSTSKATQTQATPKGNTAQGQATSLQSVSPIFSNAVTMSVYKGNPSETVNNSGGNNLDNNYLQNQTSQKKGLSRGANIGIGIVEVAGGVLVWGGTIAGASFLTVGTEGISLYFQGVMVGEELAFGAFLIGDGFARIAGKYNAPISEDVVNAALPIEKDIGENIYDMSQKD